MRMADIADAIKRNVTARQAAEALGLQPNAAGFCRCPIHGEKTGSMKVYPGQRGWYCFGCHTGGSVIDLVMLCCDMNMKQAVAKLNEDFNLGLPIDGEASPEQQEAARRMAEQRKREQQKREQRKREEEAAYNRYCDIGYQIGQYELDRMQYAPKTEDEDMDPRYVRAMMELPKLEAEAERLATICIRKEEKD